MRIYTDGSCRFGVGGWAWWNEDTKKWKSGSEFPSTNQRMELYAALDALNEYGDEKDLTIISDSAYLVNCFGERWWVKWLQNGWFGSTTGKEIRNRDIWEPLLEIVEKNGNIKFEWIKGHSGVPGNDKVDAMALREVMQHEQTAKQTAPDQGRKRSRVRKSGRDAPRLSADDLPGPDLAGDQETVSSGGSDRFRHHPPAFP